MIYGSNGLIKVFESIAFSSTSAVCRIEYIFIFYILGFKQLLNSSTNSNEYRVQRCDTAVTTADSTTTAANGWAHRSIEDTNRNFDCFISSSDYSKFHCFWLISEAMKGLLGQIQNIC